MPTDQIVQYCLSGITVGSIYAIVAIGFNIIYNTTGVINFAQGEFVVLGAMTAISLAARMPLAIAVGLAALITALIGALVELLFIRPVEAADGPAADRHHHRRLHPPARGGAARLGRESARASVLHGDGGLIGHAAGRARLAAGALGAGRVRG